jgi:predicted component of type VI protein secretion system
LLHPHLPKSDRGQTFVALKSDSLGAGPSSRNHFWRFLQAFLVYFDNIQQLSHIAHNVQGEQHKLTTASLLARAQMSPSAIDFVVAKMLSETTVI